jgi:hypothetical protein
MSMVYFCCQQNRRDAVLKHPTLNGIDFLEVLDDPAQPLDQRQRTLFVHFLKPLALGNLALKNFQLAGGERIRGVAIVSISLGTDAHILTVQVDQPGDFSIYTLSLISADTENDPDHPTPPLGIDPLLSAVDFSFKVGCPSDFDCKAPKVCPAEPQSAPDIDYLAKDYNSFRQLMLDRMSALMPQWQERNVADLGVTLVELLAYVGDHLSYQQDAVATEAYLGTAQHRVSVRRHARLVDYFMHDGCNARVWVQIQTNTDALPITKGTKLLTASGAQPGLMASDSATLNQALRSGAEGFETMHDVLLFVAHKTINFYTWGDGSCCLPKGATRATLQDDPDDPQKHLCLRAGDVLIFEEQFGPDTGAAADADPTRRHAVRLTWVAPATDPLSGQAIVEIEWASEDALPFPFCLAVVTKDGSQASVALGNIVLADHGVTIDGEMIGTVPDGTLSPMPSDTGDRCKSHAPQLVPPRFRPRLQNAPLTMTVMVEIPSNVPGQGETTIATFNPKAPASAAILPTPEAALPAISLTSSNGSWQPQRDLLASDWQDAEFVVEAGDDGVASLRFGDDHYGMAPKPGQEFLANYRVGNGTPGNIGQDTLVNIISTDTTISNKAIKGVRNPLPASGGIDPETIEHVRQNAPSAFRVQERAVTPADYAQVAERHSGIQQAAATFRWTGSWRTVFLTVDRLGGLDVDAGFKAEMLTFMEPYRMAGHDLEIDGPLYVSLRIEMTVCVKADYFRSDVEEVLLQVLSDRVLPDGTRGVFHPDNFTFGQTVYLSPLYAAAMKVEGVAAVEVTTFERQATPDPNQVALKAGKLTLARLEIARLDNDPDFPEHGVLTLNMDDGK